MIQSYNHPFPVIHQHAKAKELIAAFAAFETDKLFETKGESRIHKAQRTVVTARHRPRRV